MTSYNLDVLRVYHRVVVNGRRVRFGLLRNTFNSCGVTAYYLVLPFLMLTIIRSE